MDKYFFIFVVVGFLAQMIDGALGMGYGTISALALLNLGIPPAVTSAGVHAAKFLTGGISGLAHLKFGNVDRDLFKRLLIPGSLGGLVGAFILTNAPEKIVKPVVGVYLTLLGALIFYKALKKIRERVVTTHIMPLAFTGGLLDAAGGGWGPIVTSTLMARGNNPRMTVGSVNLAEFFVSLTQLVTLLAFLGTKNLQGVVGLVPIIAGLMVGGMMAAPLAAYVCKRIPAHALMILVGILILTLSARTIYLALAL